METYLILKHLEIRVTVQDEGQIVNLSTYPLSCIVLKPVTCNLELVASNNSTAPAPKCGALAASEDSESIISGTSAIGEPVILK